VTKSPVEFGLSISRRERKLTPCLFQLLFKAGYRHAQPLCAVKKNTEVFGSAGATEGPTEMAFVKKSPVDLSVSIPHKMYEDHLQAWSSDDPRRALPKA
jgi:hypothetical protein